jgi:hypothetical protein
LSPWRARATLAAVDESLRSVERSALEAPSDDAAACAWIAALARAMGGAPMPVPFAPAREPIVFTVTRAEKPAEDGKLHLVAVTGRALLGPLLALETERLRSVDPAYLHVDAGGVAWIDGATERGRALDAAVRRVRLLQLEHLARHADASFASWSVLNAAIDEGQETALEALGRILAEPAGASAAADRVAHLLAARDEPSIGRFLARLTRMLPSESRPRVYAALAVARVRLDEEARNDLRVSIAREMGPVRARAYAALVRGASPEDLRKDHAAGPPEVRAAALGELVARVDRTDGETLIRHALVDREPQVRRAALQVLCERAWARHPRAGEWGMGRLLDTDRTVRHAALELVRRYPLAERHLPRLRLIVAKAPPGIRPGLERLLEHHERRAR